MLTLLFLLHMTGLAVAVGSAAPGGTGIMPMNSPPMTAHWAANPVEVTDGENYVYITARFDWGTTPPRAEDVVGVTFAWTGASAGQLVFESVVTGPNTPGDIDVQPSVNPNAQSVVIDAMGGHTGEIVVIARFSVANSTVLANAGGAVTVQMMKPAGVGGAPQTVWHTTITRDGIADNDQETPTQPENPAGGNNQQTTTQPQPDTSAGGNNQQTPTQPESPDVPAGSILVRHAYLIGNNGLVRPRGNITRAEVATIFFRLITDTERSNNWMQTNPFTDVELNNWFNNAVSTTANMGLFQGATTDTFAPQRNITRAEFAAVMVRFFDDGAGTVGSDQFNDIAGHWARDYINTAASNEWVQGPQGIGGPFNPNQTVTRAEVAAMVNRAFGRIQESPADLLSGMNTWSDNASESAWYYLYIQSATNSYTYEWKTGGVYERWLELITPRDWTVLERPDSRPGDITRAG